MGDTPPTAPLQTPVPPTLFVDLPLAEPGSGSSPFSVRNIDDLIAPVSLSVTPSPVDPPKRKYHRCDDYGVPAGIGVHYSYWIRSVRFGQGRPDPTHPRSSAVNPITQLDNRTSTGVTLATAGRVTPVSNT